MKQRKIPMRKCVACQTMHPKKELIRVVRDPQGEVHIDEKGKAAGRGAYICRNADCFLLAKKKRALDRSLEAEIPDDIYDRLQVEWLGIRP
jgi:predicted RNA-binding protein YlxR (DUF448 family)